jgi:hypothetical protein
MHGMVLPVMVHNEMLRLALEKYKCKHPIVVVL